MTILKFTEQFPTEKSCRDNLNYNEKRESKVKKNVAVIAESVPLEDLITRKKSKSCRCFKMKVLNTHKTDSINDVVAENLKKETVVFSDRANTYLNISDYVETHLSEKSNKETTDHVKKTMGTRQKVCVI